MCAIFLDRQLNKQISVWLFSLPSQNKVKKVANGKIDIEGTVGKWSKERGRCGLLHISKNETA